MWHFARSFESATSFPEAQRRLQDVTGAEWHARDNDDWGDYLTSLIDRRIRGRLFLEGGRWVLDIASNHADSSALEDLVARMLRALEARDVREAETFDLRAGSLPAAIEPIDGPTDDRRHRTSRW